jgi:hypothetical protein
MKKPETSIWRKALNASRLALPATLICAAGLFLWSGTGRTEVLHTDFTSTQSGNWGDPATWGGGVPGCGDGAIIANGHTVTLNSDIGGSGCDLDITITSGSILDLGGFEINFSGNNRSFTNNGTLTNSGAFNRLRSENGGANFNFAGHGTYSGNHKLENVSSVWHIATDTSFTFSNAANNVNFQIDHPAGLDLGPNDLNLIGPSGSSDYVIFDYATGALLGGTGNIKTEGNIRIKAPNFIDRPVETVSGDAQGEGVFRVGWTVDTDASLTLSNQLTVSNQGGGSGLIIESGGLMNLAGNQLNIAFNGAFTNNGAVHNSGGFNRIVFMDNGTHTLSGAGTYAGNVGLEAFNNTTNIASGTSLFFFEPTGNVNIQVDAAANLNFNGPGDIILSDSVNNDGAIRFNNNGPSCGDANKITVRSSVNGTQRAWTGGGLYQMNNIDAMDQAGTATIHVNGGLNAGNNGPNWSFTHCAFSRADFDGDGRTDVSVFRPSDGIWYTNRSGTGFRAQPFGMDGDIPAPGDYDNDGRTDIAVFRGSANPDDADFFVLNSSNGTVTFTNWGLPGDIPIVGDYDGDGRADFAVWRPSEAFWFVLPNRQDGERVKVQFGLAGDRPMVMDYEGDGRANLTVYRPDEGRWYIARPVGLPSENFDAVDFGRSGDRPVPADYDGDGIDDIAVFRPDKGPSYWYVLRSSDDQVRATQFGEGGDVPVPGDYDGDGTDDIAVYRDGVWYVDESTGGPAAFTFGLGSDIPIPNRYIP